MVEELRLQTERQANEESVEKLCVAEEKAKEERLEAEEAER